MTHPDFPEIVGEEEVARYVIKGKGKAETQTARGRKDRQTRLSPNVKKCLALVSAGTLH